MKIWNRHCARPARTLERLQDRVAGFARRRSCRFAAESPNQRPHRALRPCSANSCSAAKFVLLLEGAASVARADVADLIDFERRRRLRAFAPHSACRRPDRRPRPRSQR